MDPDYLDRVCRKKRAYRKKAAARRALSEHFARHGGYYRGRRLQVYKCPHCKLYHLGHGPMRDQSWVHDA